MRVESGTAHRLWCPSDARDGERQRRRKSGRRLNQAKPRVDGWCVYGLSQCFTSTSAPSSIYRTSTPAIPLALCRGHTTCFTVSVRALVLTRPIAALDPAPVSPRARAHLVRAWQRMSTTRGRTCSPLWSPPPASPARRMPSTYVQAPLVISRQPAPALLSCRHSARTLPHPAQRRLLLCDQLRRPTGMQTPPRSTAHTLTRPQAASTPATRCHIHV